ncbi:MAG: amino acid permease [Streptosporangiaceae bacterium]
MAIFESMQADRQLRRALRVRHLVMLAVGGTIASGFLLFAGSAIGLAGPAVIVSYIIAGIITVAVMACLAELCVTKPVSASFATYARDTMGPLAGFMTGWNYWLAWVMGAATESLAAGTYFHSFYSFAPVWLVAAIIIAIEMAINLVGVLFMGEYEFILSTIKIIALAAFILIGICAIVGIGFHSHGVTQLTANHGFFPNGTGAVFTALLTVFFAYAGIELVGVTAEESVNPARDVPRALFYTVGIVVALFVIGIFILMAILPWATAGTSSSPFVDAIKSLNMPVVATIFNWIVISASVSSVDGALYTASRMLFAQAREGNFPKALAVTHPRRKVPILAIAVTASCMFVGALLAYFFPASAYVFVASLSAFGFLFAWLMIALAQPLYRRKMGQDWVRNLKWKTPFYPLTPIIAVVTVIGALVGQFFTGGSGTKIGPITIPGGGVSVVVGVIWTIIWSIYFLAYARRRFGHGDEWRSQEDAVAAETTAAAAANPDAAEPLPD